MLKFGRKQSSDKDKLGNNLFQFTKIAEHGFPHKPSALSYDPDLRLLAIGSQTGIIKVYGQPGVELVSHDAIETKHPHIQELYFLRGQGRLVSVCDNGEQNSLHLWEMIIEGGRTKLKEAKGCTLEGRLKKISVCCLSTARNSLYIGTEGGHIYVLDLLSFQLRDHVIYQDIVLASLSGDTGKITGGSVESLKEHPHDPSQLLIGYRKGIVILWNQDKLKCEGVFRTPSRDAGSSHDVEDVAWNPLASRFVSAHENGSLSTWTLAEGDGDEVVQESFTPFGPFPCKAIQKVQWHDSLMIFSGGLSRANYGDKHAITILQDNQVQVVLDFTSKILDFFTIFEKEAPSGLAVLCEEELVVVDIKNQNQGFPCFDKPYLACLHSSSITSSHHVSNCPEDLWDSLHLAGEKQTGGDWSSEEWPVSGGKPLNSEIERLNILLTG